MIDASNIQTGIRVLPFGLCFGMSRREVSAILGEPYEVMTDGTHQTNFHPGINIHLVDDQLKGLIFGRSSETEKALEGTLWQSVLALSGTEVTRLLGPAVKPTTSNLEWIRYPLLGISIQVDPGNDQVTRIQLSPPVIAINWKNEPMLSAWATPLTGLVESGLTPLGIRYGASEAVCIGYLGKAEERVYLKLDNGTNQTSLRYYYHGFTLEFTNDGLRIVTIYGRGMGGYRAYSGPTGCAFNPSNVEYEEIVDELGPPDSDEYSGLRRALWYDALGVTFELHKRAGGIIEARYVKRPKEVDTADDDEESDED